MRLPVFTLAHRSRCFLAPWHPPFVLSCSFLAFFSFRRFKEIAGEHFTVDDPWYSNEPARIRTYHPNGRVAGTYALPHTRWRFVLTSEGRRIPKGKAIRVWNTPAAIFSRHPGNWGWIAQSCWHVSTSWELPRKGQDPLLDDENLEVTTETQKYEVLCYNSGIVWVFKKRASEASVCIGRLSRQTDFEVSHRHFR